MPPLQDCYSQEVNRKDAMEENAGIFKDVGPWSILCDESACCLNVFSSQHC